VSAPDRHARDQATIADILRARRLVVQFVGGLDGESFVEDLKTQAVMLHEIMIIGEGARRLSDDFQAANASIPWLLIAGMRNRVIHQYDTVDLEAVWKTVTPDIPALIRDLERLGS
jgi:uncharacterized protein with HEPN domain